MSIFTISMASSSYTRSSIRRRRSGYATRKDV